MATTPVLKLPYPAPTDPADVPTDIQKLATSIDTMLGSVGTALPASPVDGQEYFYVADATNGIIWHLRYRAASASTHKWEFVGGPPLAPPVTNVASPGSVTATGAWQEINSNARMTLPLAGDYELNLWMWCLNTTANAVGISLSAVNIAAPTTQLITSVTISVLAGGGGFAAASLMGRAINLPAGAVISPAALTNSTPATYNIEGGNYRALPVRVG
jgi:hypothetical protein